MDTSMMILIVADPPKNTVCLFVAVNFFTGHFFHANSLDMEANDVSVGPLLLGF
jgi:hypothetical protein